LLSSVAHQPPEPRPVTSRPRGATTTMGHRRGPARVPPAPGRVRLRNGRPPETGRRGTHEQRGTCGVQMGGPMVPLAGDSSAGRFTAHAENEGVTCTYICEPLSILTHDSLDLISTIHSTLLDSAPEFSTVLVRNQADDYARLDLSSSRTRRCVRMHQFCALVSQGGQRLAGFRFPACREARNGDSWTLAVLQSVSQPRPSGLVASCLIRSARGSLPRVAASRRA
jgi:hypothetical protein